MSDVPPDEYNNTQSYTHSGKHNLHFPKGVIGAAKEATAVPICRRRQRQIVPQQRLTICAARLTLQRSRRPAAVATLARFQHHAARAWRQAIVVRVRAPENCSGNRNVAAAEPSARGVIRRRHYVVAHNAPNVP